MQLVNTLPIAWRREIRNSTFNPNILFTGQGLQYRGRLLSLKKLISKEIYNMIVNLNDELPTAQYYFANCFPESFLKWCKIYPLPRIVTRDSSLRLLQYKILNNILFLNKKLFQSHLSDSAPCSYCHTFDENPSIYLENVDTLLNNGMI